MEDQWFIKLSQKNIIPIRNLILTKEIPRKLFPRKKFSQIFQKKTIFFFACPQFIPLAFRIFSKCFILLCSSKNEMFPFSTPKKIFYKNNLGNYLVNFFPPSVKFGFQIIRKEKSKSFPLFAVHITNSNFSCFVSTFTFDVIFACFSNL